MNAGEISGLKEIVTVLLAEDHAAFRKSVKILVESDGDMRVIGEARNGCEAVALNQQLRPQVIIMDIRMPLLNGLLATLQILKESPSVRILILSSHKDPDYIRQAVVCGASGYVVKQSSTHLIAQKVREVLKANRFLCSSISKTLMDEYQKLYLEGEYLRRTL